MAAADRLATLAGLHSQQQFAFLLFHAGRSRFQTELDSIGFEGFLQLSRDVCILAREQLLSTMHNSDTASKSAEHLSEFKTDVPASHYKQMLRDFFQVH